MIKIALAIAFALLASTALAQWTTTASTSACGAVGTTGGTTIWPYVPHVAKRKISDFDKAVDICARHRNDFTVKEHDFFRLPLGEQYYEDGWKDCAKLAVINKAKNDEANEKLKAERAKEEKGYLELLNKVLKDQKS